MEANQALEIVKGQLKEKRYVHTLGVKETAVELAERFNANVKKAELAAIFHDYAKYRPKDEMESIIIQEQMPSKLLTFHHELWHAPVGAYLIEKEVGISDSDILLAVRYHTTGRKNMTLLEKVVFLADYIEPGRSFPGVEEVRDIAKQNLDMAVTASLKNTISFLLEKNQAIYPDTFKAYNYLMQN